MGERVRYARKQRGLTQAELAERVGWKPPYQCRIESDSIDHPSAGIKLADELNVPREWMLWGRMPGDYFDSEYSRTVNRMMRLTSAELKLVKQFVKDLPATQ